MILSLTAVMPIEDQLSYKRLMRSAMASRKRHNYLYFKIFYGGQKLHKCCSYLLIKDTSLSTCSYIGELRNGWKIKCENKPFIVFILISIRVLF